MSDKKKPEELKDSELGDVTGGATNSLIGLETEGLKPRLTNTKGIGVETDISGIRAGKGSKLRPSGVKGRIKGRI